jgi:aspartyl-tRNA(Asn)/glutamyl-tRNA(Gln) amidotransferase subunit C
MSLTPQDIDRIANLARLELQPDEAAQAQHKINGFFRLVEAMQGVNTQGVVPLAHPIEVVQTMALRLREDLASEPNAREANQGSAPAVERGLFLVPKVIE